MFYYDEWYESPENYKLFTMKNRKRCCSCKGYIANGDLSTEFTRYRRPVTDIEEALKIRDAIDALKLKLTPQQNEQSHRLQLLKDGHLDAYKAKLLKE